MVTIYFKTIFGLKLVDLKTCAKSLQPPKYANGEIEEYVLLYTDRLDTPDREWIVDTTKGDRLSMTIVGLVPAVTFYFKIQVCNAGETLALFERRRL